MDNLQFGWQSELCIVIVVVLLYSFSFINGSFIDISVTFIDIIITFSGDM